MLIRFTVSNFMSFKNETEFNMLPSKGNGSRQLQHHIIRTSSGIDVLKTAAIYGANAAGKSNLVKAIEYLKQLVTTEIPLLIPQSLRFRLDPICKNTSTTFRIEYEYQGKHFDYAIEILKGKIIEEWLYLISSVSKNKENLLYKRVNEDIEFGEYFKNVSELNYAKIFLKKELLVTQTVANALYGVFEENSIINVFCEAISKIHVVLPNAFNVDYTKSVLLGIKSLEFSKQILSKSNTGIKDIVLKKQAAENFFGHEDDSMKNNLIDRLEALLEKRSGDTKNPSVVFVYRNNYYAFFKEDSKYFVFILNTLHGNSNELFDFEEESDGTNRLFQLSPAFEELIDDDDVTYVIDELERSMHPLLAKELLKMYAVNSTSKSQLIFTTHESHLLDNDLLRRDEIWFTEKKTDGSTEFYPLSNFNPRGDKVLERGYLEGRYGGIPFLGDFSKLVVKETAINE